MAARNPSPKPKKPNRGKPAHRPTAELREYVRAMAGYGIPEIDIARVISGGIDPKTLRKHYRHELDTGHVEANAVVAGALFKNAKDGNVAAQIFWCKTRLGWRETEVRRHEGPGGGPLQQVDPSQLAGMNDAELAELERIFARLAQFGLNTGRT